MSHSPASPSLLKYRNVSDAGIAAAPPVNQHLVDSWASCRSSIELKCAFRSKYGDLAFINHCKLVTRQRTGFEIVL
jgi:hypothetical protein